MGNIGGIEKIMVFGILLIIIVILAIAVYSATRVENDMTLNAGDDGDGDGAISLFDPEPQQGMEEKKAGFSKPLFRDRPAKRNGPASLKNNSLVNRSEGKTPGDGGNDLAETPSGGPSGKTEGSDNGTVALDKDEMKRPGADTPKTPAKKTPESASPKRYTVKQGDSFMKIARLRYGDEKMWRAIADANPAVDPYNLQVGQEIVLPDRKAVEQKNSDSTKPDAEKEQKGGKRYTVKQGDTLVRISQQFFGKAGKWQEIYQANRDVIANPDVLPVGVVLKIP